MNWRERANDILNKIDKYKRDKDGWKPYKKSKDVTVWWKHSPDWNGALYKCEALINADPETVFRYVDPMPNLPREKWDKAIKELQIVEQMDKDLCVVRTITHSAFGGLISSRDFTDLSLNVRDDESVSTNAEGVDHPGCPSGPEHVRGKNYPCSIICYKVPDNPDKTKLVSYIQTDLGGMLPKALVENALPNNQVNFYTTLRKILKEEGLWKDDPNI